MSSPRACGHRLTTNRIRAYLRRHGRLVPLLGIAFVLVVFSFTVTHFGSSFLPNLSFSKFSPPSVSRTALFNSWLEFPYSRSSACMHLAPYKSFAEADARGQSITEPILRGTEEAELFFNTTGINPRPTNLQGFDFVPGEDNGEAWKRTSVNATEVQEDWKEWLQKHDKQLPALNISSAGNSSENKIDPPPNPRSSAIQTDSKATASDPSLEDFSCNRSHPRADICHMRGTIQVKGGPQSAYKLYSDNEAFHKAEEIQPYPRKWEPPSMERVQVIKLQGEKMYNYRSFYGARGLARCDIEYLQPALLFSTGGYSGNLYHDFNDALIPLFIGSSHLKGEVIFLVSDFRDWWITRYINIIRQLTNYDLVDLGTDERVHCFRDMTVGLGVHGELHIDPDRMPQRETIHDFQHLLARAFRNSSYFYYPAKWQTAENNIRDSRGRSRPKLVILARLQNRVIENENEVVQQALTIGFDVQVLKPVWETDLSVVYHTLQDADAMLGVHGAALTHILFLRPGSVFLQIIPIGVDLPAAQYFGDPAWKMGLRYISYRVNPEESTLIKIYNRTDPIIKDSDSIAARSWEVRRITYMEGQDVTLSKERIFGELMRVHYMVTCPGCSKPFEPLLM